MGLNISSARVVALASEVARRTGRTETAAVEMALTRLVAELDRQEGPQARRERVLATVVNMRARVQESGADLSTDDLYDDDGLPGVRHAARLRQYRSIKGCDVRLGSLTVLIGPNGSGKSNFVDSLRFVAQALDESLDHALRERGGWRRCGAAPRVIRTTSRFASTVTRPT